MGARQMLFYLAEDVALISRWRVREWTRKTISDELTAGRKYHTSNGKRVTLYSKIAPFRDTRPNVVPKLNAWLDSGKPVRLSELQRIILDLRKSKKFSQALQVSEWMKRKEICEFTPTEHALQLDLIGRVRGFAFAEAYFIRLSNEDKTNETYGALLNCYARGLQTEKALSHFDKMKEMGFSISTENYNTIMSMYVNIGQRDKIINVFEEMKRNKILKDNLSYRIVINAYGRNGNIGEISSLLKEMEDELHITMDWNTYAVVAYFYIKAGVTDDAIDALKKCEDIVDKKDGLGYNHLISLYTSLGNKYEVLRLCALVKIHCKKCLNRDYFAMLDSLAKLGELGEADKYLIDWESSGNFYEFRIPEVIFSAYTERGMIEKAEAVLERFKKKGKDTSRKSWEKITEGYVKRGQMDRALNSMKAALALSGNSIEKNPNTNLVTDLLYWLGDHGSVEEVEDFVRILKPMIPMDRRMYNVLIKANVKAGNDVSAIHERMKADEIKEDAETLELLNLAKNTGEKVALVA